MEIIDPFTLAVELTLPKRESDMAIRTLFDPSKDIHRPIEKVITYAGRHKNTASNLGNQRVRRNRQH